MGDALLPVHAFAVSATVVPRTVADLFAAGTERVRAAKTISIARYATGGWAVVHDFGALVFVGVDKSECDRVMRALAERLAEPRAPLEETFAVEIEPGAPPAVRFDRVVVPELDARFVEIISLVVAQSVAMEYYEGDVDALVGTLEKQARALAEGGVLSGRWRGMLRFVGHGMLVRSQVVHTLSLLESPGATWEHESLDRLYRGLRAAFEIEERYRALDHELRIVQDDLALMIDVVTQRRSMLLEVAVVVLIVLELVVLLLQVLLPSRGPAQGASKRLALSEAPAYAPSASLEQRPASAGAASLPALRHAPGSAGLSDCFRWASPTPQSPPGD